MWLVSLVAMLSIMYMPWFDEVFMSNISSSFLTTGKFTNNLPVHQLGSEVIEYGPVTFWIQSSFFRLFGENILAGRIINLLFGFALFFLIYNWVKNNYTILSARLILLFLLTDMAILTLLMCGRLDFISVFLFSLGLFQFLKSKNTAAVISAGFLFGLAFLSTPRMGVYLLAFAPFFLIECFTKKSIKENVIKYATLFFAFIIPVGAWIFIKFGDIPNYIKHYTDNPLITQHIGGVSILPKTYQIIPFLLILLLIMYRFKKKIKIPEYVWLFIAIIILHLIFIKEIGPYSGMMMPFVYIVLAILIDKQLIQDIKCFKYVFVVYLSAMFLIFMLKDAVTLATFSSRNPITYENQIAQKIKVTKQTKILADIKYYYILKDMNVIFKPFDYILDPVKQEDLQKFDYIIVNDAGLKKVKDFIPEANFQKTAIVADDNNKAKIPSFLKGFYNDYNGWIITLKTPKGN